MGQTLPRHRLCPDCSTAMPEAAEQCLGCGAVLRPVVHTLPAAPRRSWTWRLVDFTVTASLVFLAATALQRYYLSSSVDAAATLRAAQKAELAQISPAERGDLLLGADLCGYAVRDPLEALIGPLVREPRGPLDQVEAALSDAERAALLARCDDFGAVLRGLALVE